MILDFRLSWIVQLQPLVCVYQVEAPVGLFSVSGFGLSALVHAQKKGASTFTTKETGSKNKTTLYDSTTLSKIGNIDK
jgi:hypothetical protein